MKPPSQAQRIFRRIMLVAAGCVLLLALGIGALVTQSVRARDAYYLEGLMGLLAVQSEAILMFEDGGSAEDLLSMLDQADVLGRVELHLASGTLLARHELAAVEPGWRGLKWLLPVLTLERDIQVEGRHYGRLTLKGRCSKSRHELLAMYRNIAVLAALALILGALLAQHLARRLNAPLWSLQKQLQTAGGDQGPRLETAPDAAPELQAIAQQCNSLLTELEHCRREWHESDAALLHLGSQDPLTGFLDRVAFERHRLVAIRQARKQSSRLGMLYLELEDFGRIEAGLEPDAAAQLLREVVTRLQLWLPADAVVTRRDAGQFMLLLRAPPAPEQLDERARRLREALEAPYSLQTAAVTLRAGIGWAVYPDTVDTPDALTWAADAIMYGRRAAHPSDQSRPEGHS